MLSLSCRHPTATASTVDLIRDTQPEIKTFNWNKMEIKRGEERNAAQGNI